ncbi:fungal hydrophobin-domain-containing protein [Cunninghamella echinulata]|nr:fungal hydrophobin-domain-containing protein [Cunninghamella echinulata]
MKLSTVAAIVFGSAVCYAGAIPRENIGNQCNTGPVQCCNTLRQYNDFHPEALTSIFNIVGVSAEDVLRGQLGVDCTSVSVAGGSGQNCNTQPVCCSQVQQNGIVGINCTPINVNG